MSTDKYQIVKEDYDNVDVAFHNTYDTTREYMEQIKGFAGNFIHGQTILNVGGTVAECRYFADAGCKVTNLDMSQAMLDHISETDNRIKLVGGNIKNYEDAAFDGIWACRSLIHIPPEDLTVVLKNIYSLLADDGVFGCIMFTTDSTAPKEEYFPEPHTQKDGTMYYRVLYNPEGLVTIFESSGYRVFKKQMCTDKDGEHSLYLELFKKNLPN